MRGLAAIAMGALLGACGAERPAPRTPGHQGAPAPTRQDIDVESWAFVCPQGTSLQGHPPPAGRALWCERPDGTRHGPFLRWRPSGTLAELGEYTAGEPTWTFPCTSETQDICHHLLP